MLLWITLFQVSVKVKIALIAKKVSQCVYVAINYMKTTYLLHQNSSEHEEIFLLLLLALPFLIANHGGTSRRSCTSTVSCRAHNVRPLRMISAIASDARSTIIEIWDDEVSSPARLLMHHDRDIVQHQNNLLVFCNFALLIPTYVTVLWRESADRGPFFLSSLRYVASAFGTR